MSGGASFRKRRGRRKKLERAAGKTQPFSPHLLALPWLTALNTGQRRAEAPFRASVVPLSKRKVL